jgi:hypothetical protein
MPFQEAGNVPLGHGMNLGEDVISDYLHVLHGQCFISMWFSSIESAIR